MHRRNKSLSAQPATRAGVVRGQTLTNIIIAGAALAMLAPLFIWGQNIVPPEGRKAEQQDSGETVFSSETRLVPLNVTVIDKSGHLVTNLPQTAFQVFENGVQQQIKLFRREDVPVSLALIIDNSGSMREKRQGVEAAALALVKESNPMDEVCVINFNDEVYLDADFTNDISKMEQGLTKIDSRGGTAMRDAIRLSVQHLRDKAKRDKKVILVVTDGNDNASQVSLDALVREAQQNDVLIYAIGLLTEEDRREAKKAQRALQLLTESTGGAVFYPKEVSEVDRIAHQVAHDIRNQYTIAYTPTNAALDGTFRQVKVMVKGQGNPVARTRSGYYATADKGKATKN